MRKCLLILFVLGIISLTTSAQENYDYQYGIKFGINFAKFTGEDAQSFRNATGLNAGFILRKHFTEKLYLQCEVLISEKGALDTQTIDSTNMEITWFMNYFELPVIIGIDFFKNQNVPLNPVFYGGGFLGIKSTAKVRADYDDVSNELRYEEAKSMDYGFILGGSLEFELKESRIILDLRYTKSLTTFDNAAIVQWDLKHQVISATLGYIF